MSWEPLRDPCVVRRRALRPSRLQRRRLWLASLSAAPLAEEPEELEGAALEIRLEPHQVPALARRFIEYAAYEAGRRLAERATKPREDCDDLDAWRAGSGNTALGLEPEDYERVTAAARERDQHPTVKRTAGKLFDWYSREMERRRRGREPDEPDQG